MQKMNHGRTPSWDQVGGYYREDLNTNEGVTQCVKNFFDKNPTKRFAPFETTPFDEGYDANLFEMACMNLRTKGFVVNASGLSFKLHPKLKKRREAGEDITKAKGVYETN